MPGFLFVLGHFARTVLATCARVPGAGLALNSVGRVFSQGPSGPRCLGLRKCGSLLLPSASQSRLFSDCFVACLRTVLFVVGSARPRVVLALVLACQATCVLRATACEFVRCVWASPRSWFVLSLMCSATPRGAEAHAARQRRATMTQALVESVLVQTGLASCDRTIAGDLLRKGLSGGQKKRLCVAEAVSWCWGGTCLVASRGHPR